MTDYSAAANAGSRSCVASEASWRRERVFVDATIPSATAQELTADERRAFLILAERLSAERVVMVPPAAAVSGSFGNRKWNGSRSGGETGAIVRNRGIRLQTCLHGGLGGVRCRRPKVITTGSGQQLPIGLTGIYQGIARGGSRQRG